MCIIEESFSSAVPLHAERLACAVYGIVVTWLGWKAYPRTGARLGLSCCRDNETQIGGAAPVVLHIALPVGPPCHPPVQHPPGTRQAVSAAVLSTSTPPPSATLSNKRADSHPWPALGENALLGLSRLAPWLARQTEITIRLHTRPRPHSALSTPALRLTTWPKPCLFSALLTWASRSMLVIVESGLVSYHRYDRPALVADQWPFHNRFWSLPLPPSASHHLDPSRASHQRIRPWRKANTTPPHGSQPARSGHGWVAGTGARPSACRGRPMPPADAEGTIHY